MQILHVPEPGDLVLVLTYYTPSKGKSRPLKIMCEVDHVSIISERVKLKAEMAPGQFNISVSVDDLLWDIAKKCFVLSPDRTAAVHAVLDLETQAQ